MRRPKPPYLQSLYIYTTTQLTISFHQSGDKLFLDQGLHSFKHISDFQQFTVDSVKSQTPDSSDFLIIASTDPSFEFKLTHVCETKTVSSQSTTDAYATLFERYVPAYETVTFDLFEVGASNGFTYKVERRSSNSGDYVEIVSDTAVAASGNDKVEVIDNASAVWIKVSVKSTSAGNAASVTGNFYGVD